MGLVCFGLTVLVVERRRSRWWLLPIVWVWVNAHGSFPLGLLWIGATCVGAWIDRRHVPSRADEAPWSYFWAFVAGLALAAVNPLGPRLLTFAGTVVSKHEVFRNIVEWKSANFQSNEGVVCLIGLVASFAIVSRRRVGWRYLLPAAGFLGLGLLAQRNLAPLGVVMAPVLAAAFRTQPVASDEVRRVNVVLAGVIGFVALLFVVGGALGPPVDASSYPVSSIRWLEAHGRLDAPHRLITPDDVGNYLELRERRPRLVFIDDRVDMFPATVSKDYKSLLNGADPALRVLDRWKVDTLLWPSHSALADRLAAGGKWRVVHRERGFVVFELSL